MKHANRIIDGAFSYFRIGYNCAESVLLAIAKDTPKINCDFIPKIATGFGGGISRRGYVCGAVSGTVMGFGLKYGRNSPEELQAKTCNRVVEFYKQFQEKFGSIVCEELCGFDLSTIEGIRKFRKGNVHEQRFVTSSVAR